MGTVRPWLPSHALEDGVLEDVLSSMIHAWAAKWFVQPAVYRVAVRFSESIGRSCSSSRVPGAVEILSENAHVDVGAAMLGADLTRKRVSRNDKAVLSSLGRICFDDLQAEFDALEASYGAHWSGGAAGICCHVAAVPEQAAFDILIPANAAISLRMGAIPGARSTDHDDLLGRDQQIGRVQVEMGARIGMAKLTAIELDNLVCGDVIVTNTPVDAELDLVVDGRVQRGVKCKYERFDNKPTLRICQHEEV